MKILWVKSDFLHPTDKGGQIRTLEMLRRLHSRHEIHYVGLDLPEQSGGFGEARNIAPERIRFPVGCRSGLFGVWRRPAAPFRGFP